MSVRTAIARTSAVVVVLGMMTIGYRRFLPVNPTTVALTFLVLVLLTSAYWGFRIALFTAFAATALFNFFFLPPVGTFTISDPQNWIALLAFLTTAVVASNLSERARRQAELARERRLEVERLYSLSQQLLTSDNTAHLFNRLPGQITRTFGVQGAALVISGRDTVYRSDPDLAFDTELLLRANARGEISEAGAASYVPLRLGVRPAGALAIVGEKLSRATLEAMGSLIGIAAERTRAIEELGDTRAAQESEKLRSALLDSVTHEFRTPLTSIKASVTALQDESALDAAQQRDLLSVINEETDRLNRLVGEAAEMAQLDAHMVRLNRTLNRPGEVIAAAMENARAVLADHSTELDVPADIPEVSFDFGRISEVITHLLENAAKYSPKNSSIRVSVEHTFEELVINVADHGSGIDSMEQSLIFDKFYRGREHRMMVRGTGMGLAISKVIVEAHGGSLSVVSQPGAGSVFSIHLPMGPQS
jgi:two-component system, OmpR family, sensor histidine kinase KdpD